MSALFSSPSLPAVQPAPPTPNANDKEIAARAEDERRQRAMQGRASQFMSDPLAQGKPSINRARTLFGEAV